MAGPLTTFDADECQALLDVLDSYAAAYEWARADESTFSSEEKAALEKLRRAGGYYLQHPDQKQGGS